MTNVSLRAGMSERVAVRWRRVSGSACRVQAPDAAALGAGSGVAGGVTREALRGGRRGERSLSLTSP
eukprot:COSAG06_NODE_331_length_17352_cov_63.031098_7_plen_67_part_00